MLSQRDNGSVVNRRAVVRDYFGYVDEIDAPEAFAARAGALRRVEREIMSARLAV